MHAEDIAGHIQLQVVLSLFPLETVNIQMTGCVGDVHYVLKSLLQFARCVCLCGEAAWPILKGIMHTKRICGVLDRRLLVRRGWDEPKRLYCLSKLCLWYLREGHTMANTIE